VPELYFKGKEFVYNHHLTVPYRPLETHPDKSVGEDSGNQIIHGDNLHALKALLPHYAGKVDCIFIDPQYNTGNVNTNHSMTLRETGLLDTNINNLQQPYPPLSVEAVQYYSAISYTPFKL